MIMIYRKGLDPEPDYISSIRSATQNWTKSDVRNIIQNFRLSAFQNHLMDSNESYKSSFKDCSARDLILLTVVLRAK